MAAQARPRIKGHEAKGLGFGGVDHLPNVNAHGGIDDLQFVDQGDIDAAEYVLRQLGRLGGAAGGNRHEGLDGPAIDGLGPFEAGGRVAADDFGNERHFAVGIARVFPFRREGQMEIRPRLEAGTTFQHLPQVFVGGAGIGGGFQDDERCLS